MAFPIPAVRNTDHFVDGFEDIIREESHAGANHIAYPGEASGDLLTTQVIVFLLIAKGWSITRTVFLPGERRSVVITMILFYLLNAIILIIRASVKDNDVFWSMSCATYILMYAYIVHCAFISSFNVSTIKLVGYTSNLVTILSSRSCGKFG